MDWTLILASAACIAFLSAAIDFLLMGLAFHRFQSATPEIWRKLSLTSYVINGVLAFAFGLAFSVIFYLAFVLTPRDIASALGMGAFLWVSFPLLTHIGTANRVRLDRRYVAGRLTTTLLVYLASALAAKWVLF